MSTVLAIRRPPKRRRFSRAHPDLYVRDGGKVRLAIHDGDLLTGSLTDTRLRHFSSSGLVRDAAARAAHSTEFLWRKQYDDQTPRPDHERCDRPHGAQPAFDPLHHRDPRPGRRAARKRRPHAARPDPDRPRRGQGGAACQALQRRALVDRSRQGAGRQERYDLLRCRDHAGAAHAADQGDQRRQARLLRKADRDQSG